VAARSRRYCGRLGAVSRHGRIGDSRPSRAGCRSRRCARRAPGDGSTVRRQRTSVILARTFYDRPTLDVARDLIGKVLVHNRRGSITSGVIVEIEAYIGESDPPSHAAPGPTRRNQPMYGPPGFSYVYLNYG